MSGAEADEKKDLATRRKRPGTGFIFSVYTPAQIHAPFSKARACLAGGMKPGRQEGVEEKN